MHKIYLSIISTLILISFVASANVKYGKKWEGDIPQSIQKELKLTPAQKTKLNSLTDSTKDRFAALHDRKMAATSRIQAAAESDNDVALRSAHEELSAAMTDMSNLKFDTMMETRKILTADQRKKFAALKAEKMEKKRQKYEDDEEED